MTEPVAAETGLVLLRTAPAGTPAAPLAAKPADSGALVVASARVNGRNLAVPAVITRSDGLRYSIGAVPSMLPGMPVFNLDGELIAVSAGDHVAAFQDLDQNLAEVFVALGALVGRLMDFWAARAKESGEAMILSIGSVLIAVGACRWLGLSPLCAAFFVLAGAELVPSSVFGLGLIGVGYTVARTVGKIAGARIGLRGQNIPADVRRQLGYCLVSSSSLAVGLTIQIRTAFPAYASTVTGIVLAAVVIFEIVGPLLTRNALIRTGEAKTIPSPLRQAEGSDLIL